MQPEVAPSFRSRPPALKAGLVRRPRLLAHLRGRFDRRVTVVVAGAGYGKTTLLSQAVDENRSDPLGEDVWFLTSERDRAASHFLDGLTSCLSGTDRSGSTIDDVKDQIVLRSPAAVCLVIDDAHLLDGSESWECVARLLATMPANGHLLIGSRTAPSLPIRRLQVAEEAVVVEQRALAFTDEELAELAQRSAPSSDGGRGRLPSWPALAVLASTAGQEASLAYLWEEILGGLPTEQREALALISRLELIDDEMVAAVVGNEWTASALVSRLPLVDSIESSFRLHDLWRAALADVVPPARWRPALTAGAEVLMARGDLVRAVKYFRDAGALDRMRSVVRRFASLPLSAGLDKTEAEAILDLLPAADRAGPVGLCLEAILRWTAAEVIQALDLMLAAARSVGDDEMRALAWWRLVQLHGDTDPSLLTVSEELAELAGAGWPLARSAVALVRSHEAQERRDVEQAIAVLDDLGGDDPLTRKVALASRLLALGHPEAVSVTLDDVLAGGVEDPVAAQAVWFRGEIDPTIAWPIAAELPAAYRQRRLPAIEVPLLAIVSSVALSAGATADARDLADAAMARSHLVVPRLQLFAHVARALVALVDEGEEEFRLRLDAARRLVPLEGWPAWAYLGALAPIRALEPDAVWLDDLALGVSMKAAVVAGRATAELRAGGGPATAESLPWHEVAMLRVHVPPPLLCELAVAASRRSPTAAALVHDLPGASRWVRGLAAHPDRAVRDRAGELAALMPQRPGHDLRIEAFGGLAVRRSDGVVVPSLDRRGRLRQLLARLVMERSVPRAALAEELWPDLTPEQAANNLRVNLSKLLDVIEPERQGSGSWWIRTTGDRLELNLEGLTVDVDEFDRHLQDGRNAESQGAPSVAYDHYQAATDLYQGELLAGLDDASLLHERMRLLSLAYGAACRQAEFQLARGEPEVALEHAARAAHLDGLGERACRLMVRCHLGLGSNSAARSSAQLLLRRLADAGLAPETETNREFTRLGLTG